MTAYRAFVADRKDIEIVTVICPDCGAEVSLKIATARLPDHCPSCQIVYTLPLKDALAALGRFHRAGATAEENMGKSLFRFSIKQEG